MQQPIIAVDASLDIAPYQQIEEQIRAAVQRGDLAPGTVLPTVRQLADDLGVAPNTVARAYGDLQNEGWLISEGRRGTRVPDRLPSADKRVRANLLRDALAQVVGSLVGRGYSRTEILTEVRRLTDS